MKITATNLKKQYGDKTAVSDISFQIRKGQTLGFLGPNGSGKSTTIKMLTGEIKPDSGEIKYDDKPLSELGRNLNLQIGVMPQDVIIWEHLSILENLYFTASNYSLESSFAKQRVELLMDRLHLNGEAKTLARDLSGGYKRRLNLAMSILHDPKVIFLDEPTPGIDPQSRRAMWDFIDELKDSGEYSILLTDHYLDEAERVCDYIIIVDHGQIVTQGSMAELKQKHGSGKLLRIDLADSANLATKKVSAFKSKLDSRFKNCIVKDDIITLPVSAPEKDLPFVLSLLDHEKLAFDDISIKEPSLEDIFLLITGREIRS